MRFFPDCHYASGTVQLERGDLIVSYTDGIVEAPNAAGEEWGVDGLRNAVLANDADCADDVVDAIFSTGPLLARPPGGRRNHPGASGALRCSNAMRSAPVSH